MAATRRRRTPDGWALLLPGASVLKRQDLAGPAPPLGPAFFFLKEDWTIAPARLCARVCINLKTYPVKADNGRVSIEI
jgi:hypothetical protein